MAYRPPKRIAKLDTISVEEDGNLFDNEYSKDWYIPIDSGLDEEHDKGTVKVPMNRIALLNAQHVVPPSMLPSFVDEMTVGKMVHSSNKWTFTTTDGSGYTYACPTQATGETVPREDLIYYDEDTHIQYRYKSNTFAVIPQSLILSSGPGITMSDSETNKTIGVKLKYSGASSDPDSRALAFDNNMLMHMEYGAEYVPSGEDSTSIFPVNNANNTIKFGETFDTDYLVVNRTGHIISHATRGVYMSNVSGGQSITVDTDTSGNKTINLNVESGHGIAVDGDTNTLYHLHYMDGYVPSGETGLSIFPLINGNSIKFGESFNTNCVVVNREGHVIGTGTGSVFMPGIVSGAGINVETASDGKKTIHVQLQYPDGNTDPQWKAIDISNAKLYHIPYLSSLPFDPGTETVVPAAGAMQFGTSITTNGFTVNRTGHIVSLSTDTLYLPDITAGPGIKTSGGDSPGSPKTISANITKSSSGSSLYLLTTETSPTNLNYVELGSNFWNTFYVVSGTHDSTSGSTLYIRDSVLGNIRSDGTLRSATTDTTSPGYYIGAAYIAAGTASPVGLVLTTGSNHYIEPSSIYFTTNSDGLLSSRGYWATPNMYINTATAYVTSHASSTSNTNTYLCFNSGTGNALSSVNIYGNNGVTVSSKATSGDKNSVLTISGETSHIYHYGPSGYDWSQLDTLSALVAVHGYGTPGFSVYTRSNFGGSGGPWTWDSNGIYSRSRIICRIGQDKVFKNVPLPWIPSFAKYDLGSSSTETNIYVDDNAMPSAYISSYLCSYMSTITNPNSNKGTCILCVPPHHRGSVSLCIQAYTNYSISVIPSTSWISIYLEDTKDSTGTSSTFISKSLWHGY